MEQHLKLFANHSAYNAVKNNLDKPNVVLCTQENEVHYNPVTKHNGYEYVDLGLPSGTLWATMNVGASNVTDYGLYFQWGDTQGYIDASIKAFTWNDYKYGTYNNLTKYNSTDGKTVLDSEDDAVKANWGGEWHMPTKEQYNELFNTDYVTNAWVTDYNGSGVNGRLFTSVSNGNTVFFPAAGSCLNGKVSSIGNYGYVWTSTLYSQNKKDALILHFSSSGANSGLLYDRYYGSSVRGVVD